MWDSIREVAGFGSFVLEGDICLSACQIVGKPSLGVVRHVGLVYFVDEAASGYGVKSFADVYCGKERALWFSLVDAVCDLLCQVG